ncbi:MAG: UbiX family flavin prenyltransferase [Bacteroidetes bacterium]|nr:UbiX family flavin prenyltransferase [Rhodothermia bacterium]MCS7155929.1 UbiX family flavin prenyltransferase [Bacteroidota bacterium]MCX7905935.1 UbiX family flavin prenyltransferase [Bacteroidota bacterium]MDW8138098.1 UbiX family flavin prenyltransferase [Bacteroidota bacterium]MDW8285782.1 UbiX family flavin prenyltransferase [Bacteroidota bacterium]
MEKRIVVAITGASGAVYARRLLEQLASMRDRVAEVAVVFSAHALAVWREELDEASLRAIPFARYEPTDLSAPFASGSSRYTDMVVVPCSMGTLGRIANGASDDLITRAADVMLKERRRLVLVPRDTPLNAVHLRNMLAVTEAGAIVLPACPSFYHRPQSIEALVDSIVHRILDLIGLPSPGAFRWGEGQRTV